ncbi:unnamed protein product [Calypogeia fissa]
MARNFRLLLRIALLLVVLFVGQYGSEAKSSAKNTLAARKEDVKYIKCGVCEEIVKQLHRQVKKMKEKIAPKKLTELEIIDLTENICNIKKEEADWLMYLDIVEDGPRLKLVEQEEEGECNSECKTIERACEEVMGDHDTDVAEFLYRGEAQRSALSKLLCKDLSKACVGKPPAVPKDRVPGEPFVPKPSKDAEMAKIMRSMSDMPGAPGMQMYSRDQLQSGGFGMGDEDDEDDDSDDDEEQASEATTGGGSGLLDQAQLALGKMRSVDSAAQHVSKLSRQAKKWWYGSKSSSKRKSSKSASKARSERATKSEL